MTNEQEILICCQVFGQLNELSCLKLLCQIHFIGAAISIGKTEKRNNKRHSQWVIGRADYFSRFLNKVKR